MKPRRGRQQGTGGGATPAPSHPPTIAPDEEGITVDCLRQKGGEKQARSKQRMFFPLKGECELRTAARFPHPGLQAADRPGGGMEGFIEKTEG